MVRVRRSGSAPPTAPAAARSLDGGGSRASNRRASERRSEVTSSSSKASSSKLATAAAQWGTTSARLQSESHADVARGQFEAMMVLGGDSAARDLESAVDLCAGLVQGGMLAGVRRNLKSSGQLENGLVLIDVRGTDVFVGNTRVAPDNLPGWLRGLLRVEAAHNEALARPLQSKLDGMREEGIVADGKEWKEWGHHEEDKGFGAKRPRSDVGGEPIKKNLGPPDEARFPLPGAARRDLLDERVAGDWELFLYAAVERVRSVCGEAALPVEEVARMRPSTRPSTRASTAASTAAAAAKPSAPTAANAAAAKAKAAAGAARSGGVDGVDGGPEGYVPFESGDAAMNVNLMEGRGYYPPHTDDWATPATLPDVDGSGYHILTYVEQSSLILISPLYRAAVKGCVGLRVAAGDTWGMRTLVDASAMHARSHALHAVLNLSQEPRFSVNFRLGGFGPIYCAAGAAPMALSHESKRLGFQAPGAKNAALGGGAAVSAAAAPPETKKAKHMLRQLECDMVR